MNAKLLTLSGIFLTLLGLIGYAYLPSQRYPVSTDTDEANLLFYASFNKNFLADQAAGDEVPLGNQGVKMVREGKKGGAVYLDTESTLTYDAPANLYAERGTISFWWKLDEPLGRTPFSVVRISYAQHFTWDFTFAQLHWTGDRLRLWFRDRNSITHAVVADTTSEVVSGRWFHLAFTWDEMEGIRLYIDGHEIGHKLGELHLAANLDQVGIHASAVTPHHTSGTERKVFIDELRFYGVALRPMAIQNLTRMGNGQEGSVSPAAASSPESWNQHWKARFGWQDQNSIPKITSPALIRKLAVLSGKDFGKFWIKGSDGKRETCWPMISHGYLEEGKAIDFTVENEPFNYLLLQGNLRGQVYYLKSGRKRLLLDRSDNSGEATHVQMRTPLMTSHLRVERQEGILGELSLFSIQSLSPGQTRSDKLPMSAAKMTAVPVVADKLSYRLVRSSEAMNLQGISRNQVATLYNLSHQLSGRYLPEDRESWVGVPIEIYRSFETPARREETPEHAIGNPEIPAKSSDALRYSHVIVPPFLHHVALDAIRLKLNPEGKKFSEEATLNLSVKDPLYPLRDLINLNLRLPGEGPVEMVLDIPDIVVPAGTALWLTLASDQKGFGAHYLNGAEVEMWMAQTGHSQQAERSRKEYLSDRLRWIKDSFQMLSEARPWMIADHVKIRRQFKLVDELFTLIEDVLRVEPKEPTAAAYWGWIKRHESPPDFKQPEPPSPDIPRWAYQQQVLLKQFRQVVEWWIKNRQIETGEIGGGLGDDTDLISNWPGLALMDGPGQSIRESVRAVMEACFRQGMITDGLNTRRTDALHAYEEGINAIPIAALLDYGNPLFVERLMQTARHYERLSGINPAGHRHFRSYLFSATDLVEDGHYAREDIYSALMWHSGLYLAWYNGSPQVIHWLSEYADALLAHWQKDRYPSLARGIKFASDEVISRTLPNPEVVNLMWGVYRLTGNGRYLWLVDRLVKGGNVDRAEMTNGRWLEFVDLEPYRGAILEEARKRNIWDHNLQTDETGLLAKQQAYELSGDVRHIEDYQAALIKHMAQNMVLYTEAEQFTDRIWIPHRATQRARLGGVAHYRNYIYPGHSVSWEGSDSNVAVLVSKAPPNTLKVITFNLAKSPQEVKLRVWELENGSYEVVEGTDVNGDDQIDTVTTKRNLALKRHVAIPFTLPPRKKTIIEVRQLQKGTPLWELPDLAIGPEDLQYDLSSDKGKLVIHNIGGKQSSAFTLLVENERGSPLLKKEIEGIEAPTDLKPKTITIELSGFRARGVRTLSVKLNPDSKVEEITEENNQLRKSF